MKAMFSEVARATEGRIIAGAWSRAGAIIGETRESMVPCDATETVSARGRCGRRGRGMDSLTVSRSHTFSFCHDQFTKPL